MQPTPTPPSWHTMGAMKDQRFVSGLYISTELRLDCPSYPPTAYRRPDVDTRDTLLRRVFMATRRLHCPDAELNTSAPLRKPEPSYPPATYMWLPSAAAP